MIESEKLPAGQKRWRWVILVVSFVSTLANAPIFYAFGAFVLPWMREFSAQGATIAFVTSCGSSVSGILCPLGSFLVQRWGYRWSHVAGGVLLVMSFAASSFAQSLLHLFVSYSILGGIGSSLCMVPSINAITDHFRGHQGIALAIVTSSYGIGGLVFPLFFQALIDEYTWRGAMLITSAVFGHVVACGLLSYHVGKSPSIPACCGESDAMPPSELSLNVLIESQGERTSNYSLVLEDVSNSDTVSHSGAKSVRRAFPCRGKRNAKRGAKDEVNGNLTESIDKELAKVDKVSDEDIAHMKKRTFSDVARTLLTSGLFYLFVVHNLTSYMGYFMIFGLTPIRASYDLGMSDSQAAMLVSTFGVAQMTCRLVLGVIIELKYLKVSSIYIASYYSAGVAAFMSLLATTFSSQIIYCIVASATFATHAFYPVVVYQVFGKDLFNVAFGFLEISHGVGTVTGSFIGGFIYDVTGTCTYSFIYAGICILFSIIVLLIGLSVRNQMEKLLKE